MAVRTISTRLAIEGEAAYKASLTSINTELKTLQSALKLTQSEFASNANSMEALSSKGDALAQLYDAQAGKVGELQRALSNAQGALDAYAGRNDSLKTSIEANNKALSEMDEATRAAGQEWADSAKKIEQAEQQLSKLQKSSEDTSAAQEKLQAKIATARERMEELERSTGGAAKTAGELALSNESLNKELSENERYLDASQKGVNNWQTQLNNAQTELNKLDAELTENSKYLDEAKDSADGCATSIDEFGNKTKEGADAIDALASSLVAAGLIKAIKALAEGLIACAEAAIEFESAMAGVAKTTDFSDAELVEFGDAIKSLATKIPASTTELANIAEAAGQLGIEKNSILEFTEVMANLGVATNLSSTEAASSLAKFANVVRMSADDYGKLGAVIVDLGNNFATTEADIVAMATRLASSGSIIGLSEAEIMAVSTALSSLGINAEAGGSAISKLLKTFEVMVATSSDDLADFAKIAGMSADEFSKAWGESAVQALGMFIDGLGSIDRAGGSSIAVLEELGLTEIRLSNSVLALASSEGILTRALDTANTAWDENTALIREAETRYETTESRLQLLANNFDNLKITIGEQLTPAVNGLIDIGTGLTQWFDELVQGNEWLIPLLTSLAAGLGVAAIAIGGFLVVTKLLIPAMHALNTALSANPIFLLIAAFAAVSAVFVTFTAITSTATNKTREHVKAIQESKAAHEEVSKAIDQERQDTVGMMEALTGLIDQESRSALEKQMILDYVQQLNNVVPELALAYDEEANSLNMTADAMERVIDSEFQRQEMQEAVARGVELKREEHETAILLAEAEERLTEAQAAYAEGLDTLNPAMMGQNAQLAELEGAVAEAERAITELTAAQADNAAEMARLTEKTEAYTTSTADGFAEMEAKITAAGAAIQGELDALKAQYEAVYEGAYTSIEGTIGLFQKMDTEAVTAVKDITDALDSQIKFMDTYAENIKKAAEMGIDDGLLATLMNGSTESAAILAGIVADGGKNIDELNTKFALVEEGKDKFATTIATMQTDFDAKLAEIEGRLDNMVEHFDQAEEASKNGANTAQGYVDGLNSKLGEVESISARIANAVNNAITKANEISSPGKKPMRLAEQVGAGYVIGLQKTEDAIQAEADKIAQMVPRALESAADTGSSSVYNNTTTTNSDQTYIFSPTIYVQSGDASGETAAQDMMDALEMEFRERGWTHA